MKPYEKLVVCGSEYHFKLTTANAVALEEELGTDILSGLEKLTEIKTLSKYLFRAAVSQNDSINKIEDMYQLIDDYIADGNTIDSLQELTMDILLTSGILSQNAYDTSKKLKENSSAELLKLLEGFTKKP